MFTTRVWYSQFAASNANRSRRAVASLAAGSTTTRMELPKTSGLLIVGDPDLLTMCHGASSNKLVQRQSGSQFRRKTSVTRSDVGTPSTSSATIAIGIQSATKHRLRQGVTYFICRRPGSLPAQTTPGWSDDLRHRGGCGRMAGDDSTDIVKGNWRPPEPSRETVGAYANRCLALGVERNGEPFSPTTKELYDLLWTRWLEPIFGDVALGEVSVETVRTWLAAARSDYPSSTSQQRPTARCAPLSMWRWTTRRSPRTLAASRSEAKRVPRSGRRPCRRRCSPSQTP